MSATPIPRTLQMSLAGLRDISVIETPPEGRRPVRTFVGEYEEELVRHAIEREHARGGQAFFLHNRVETIEQTAERLRALCPGVRFAVAHGQMAEGELEAVMMDYLRGGRRRARVHLDHRVGHRHPAGQHADRRARRRLRARAALPDPRPRRAQPRARLRVPAVRLGGGARARGGPAAGGAVGLHRARRRLQDRDARPRDPRRREPARRRAVRAPRGARLRALHADDRRGGARRRARARGRGAAPSRCAWTSTSTPTCRPTTCPTSRPRSRSTAASRARVEIAELEELREELADRFGPPPAPVENLLALQRARIKFGQAGARTVSFRGERLAVVPIELDSRRARRLREELPGASYESGRSQVSVRVPKEGEERFPSVVRAADALLAIMREAA